MAVSLGDMARDNQPKRRSTDESDESSRELDGIFLGFPFDQLLNRQCPYLVTRRTQGLTARACEGGDPHDPSEGSIGPGKPGIVLPRGPHPGTGNIVICGPPGSGKSTLALQFAVACASRPENNAISAYVGLESSIDEILAKARPFGWDGYLQDLRHLHAVDESSDADRMGDILLHILRQPCGNEKAFCEGEGECRFRTGSARSGACEMHLKATGPPTVPVNGRVLLTSLSPRPIAATEANQGLFQKRRHQLEGLLSAGAALREEGGLLGRRIFPVVIIDSLNMFGTDPWVREELHQLFTLFRRYETVGAFVVETTQETPFDSTLADVVIELDAMEDGGYFVRHIEISKSRYYNQVNGRHPFKTASLHGVERTPLIWARRHATSCGELPRHGVVVFPSLHYVFLRTGGEIDPSKEAGNRWSKPGATWGVHALNQILPHNLREGSVVAVEGPRGTFKTDIALSFLAQGLSQKESCLLIALRDWPFVQSKGAGSARRIDPEQCPSLSVDLRDQFDWGDLAPFDEDLNDRWQLLVSQQKAQITGWHMARGGAQDVCLFEVDFKSGALLPEEFVEIIWDIIIRRGGKGRIRRVVLDDAGAIGAAYPFLSKSSTSGHMFLPTLAHVMRNHGIDLVVTGTTGDFVEADEPIGRIRAVADAVVSTQYCDVFGQRHVIVQGERLIGGSSEGPGNLGTSAPPVVRNVSWDEGTTHRFEVNGSYMEGLVGFQTGNVQRPGVSLYIFEENSRIHGRYNHELKVMLSAAFAADAGSAQEIPPTPSWGKHASSRCAEPQTVAIVPFDSGNSEAMHDSLAIFAKGEPIERTVICTVDEFWQSPALGVPQLNGRFVRTSPVGGGVPVIVRDSGEGVRPYYANVLLLAYRTDLGLATRTRPASWQDLNDRLRAVPPAAGLETNRGFWFDLSARETLSCALLDALASGAGICGDSGQAKSAQLSRLLNEACGIDDGKGFGLTNEHGKGMEREVLALQSVLHMTDWPNRDDEAWGDAQSVLPGDSAVCLCWYSQVRELVDRVPSLADKIGVWPLPAGGFTGDWYIGCLRGSVSTALGDRIIDILCQKEEECKRFARGVGLPVQKSFMDADFYAWDGTDKVTLRSIMGPIHSEALSRTCITDYGKIRSRLYHTGRQLTPWEGEHGGGRTMADVRERVLGRLFKQLGMLRRGLSGP